MEIFLLIVCKKEKQSVSRSPKSKILSSNCFPTQLSSTGLFFISKLEKMARYSPKVKSADDGCFKEFHGFFSKHGNEDIEHS